MHSNSQELWQFCTRCNDGDSGALWTYIRKPFLWVHTGVVTLPKHDVQKHKHVHTYRGKDLNFLAHLTNVNLKRWGGVHYEASATVSFTVVSYPFTVVHLSVVSYPFFLQLSVHISLFWLLLGISFCYCQWIIETRSDIRHCEAEILQT